MGKYIHMYVAYGKYLRGQGCRIISMRRKRWSTKPL